MYVIYNLQKIMFKLDLRKVVNTSVHYYDDKFFLAFKLNNNKTKGFPISNEYSTVATGLQDILYHMYNKSQIMYASDGKQGPELIYDVTTRDELIENSSYANTLIGEQSVFSDKTLISKLTHQNQSINNKNQKNNYKVIQSTGFDNESIINLNPKNSDYVSLNVK